MNVVTGARDSAEGHGAESLAPVPVSINALSFLAANFQALDVC